MDKYWSDKEETLYNELKEKIAKEGEKPYEVIDPTYQHRLRQGQIVLLKSVMFPDANGVIYTVNAYNGIMNMQGKLRALT